MSSEALYAPYYRDQKTLQENIKKTLLFIFIWHDQQYWFFKHFSGVPSFLVRCFHKKAKPPLLYIESNVQIVTLVTDIELYPSHHSNVSNIT